MITYDFIIIGAGIAGLYTAYNINKTYPDATICILESTNRVGGRLHSIKYDGLILDGGGARFNNEQTRVTKLIKELGLLSKVVPITNTSIYKYIDDYEFESGSRISKYDKTLETIFPIIDDFIDYMKTFIKDKKNNINEDSLLNTTILDFATEHFTNKYPTIRQYIIDIYPYYSELGILNAIEGIKLFSNEFAQETKYFILNGGYEQLTETIYNKLINLKGGKGGKGGKRTVSRTDTTLDIDIDIYTNTALEYIKNINTTQHNIAMQNIYKYEIKTNNIKHPIFKTNYLILAIPKPSLLKIKYLTKHKHIVRNLNSIKIEPLYRIYARYPLDKNTNKVWFDGMKKIVTNLPIKYIIPINYKKGVIMISYTDSKFTTFWINQLSNGTFETELYKELKQLFPDVNIPKAKWYKHCHWSIGAGYWKPKYNRKSILPEMIQPLGNNENVYICGENYSSHQAWVEGSLETADMVLDNIYKHNHKHKHKHKHNNKHKNTQIVKSRFKKYQTKKKQFGGKPKSIKEYTLEEVAKHNNKSDAWIIINSIVADITDWIPKHPGGDIIMKGVGKDATNLFNSIGHDDYAKKMLKKYQIGILKK